MPELRFEWDPKKAAANLAKHGVPFSEAKTAFSDELGDEAIAVSGEVVVEALHGLLRVHDAGCEMQDAHQV